MAIQKRRQYPINILSFAQGQNCPWNEAGECIIPYYVSPTKFTVGNKKRCEMRSAKIKCFQINRPGVLHKLYEEFFEPLMLILNISWKTGKIPKGQRTANVSRY